MNPEEYLSWTVYLFDLRSDPKQEIGEIICPTKRDLAAPRYALAYVEYIGYEVVLND